MQKLFLWKSNKYCIFRVCVYSLRYPVCNVHGACCYLWPVRFYNLSTLSHKRYEIREKKVIGHNICFDFLYIWTHLSF